MAGCHRHKLEGGFFADESGANILLVVICQLNASISAFLAKIRAPHSSHAYSRREAKSCIHKLRGIRTYLDSLQEHLRRDIPIKTSRLR